MVLSRAGSFRPQGKNCRIPLHQQAFRLLYTIHDAPFPV